MELNAIPTHPLANSYLTVEEADEMILNRQNYEGWDALTDDQKAMLLIQATAQIDSLRFRNPSLFNHPGYFRDKQGLKFPDASMRSATGKVDSATSNTITDASLAGHSGRPNDYYKGGAVVITKGTGLGETYKITGFNATTGQVTIEGNFATTPDTTTNFWITQGVPSAIKFAVVEQALYLLAGGGERARMQAEGVKSYSIGDLHETFKDGMGGGTIPLSTEARAFLTPYISKIGRMTY